VIRAENERLRAALVAKPPPSPRSTIDPWAVPAESPPSAVTAPAAESSPEVTPKRARFACRKCGELRDEADLARVGGRVYCATTCVERGGDDEPVTSGGYR
jgi:hypothetical protein